jgi:hypothetical protein
MQIIKTHKGADFDAAAHVLAAKLLYPKAVAVLPDSLNPNIMAHKDMQGCIRRLAILAEKGAAQTPDKQSCRYGCN